MKTKDMSLKSQISPEIIANSISMDKIQGYYVLIEGEKDVLFYSKFLNKDFCFLEICHGKNNVIDAIQILNDRNESCKYIGLVDSDFDNFFKPPKINNVLKTDAHSIEAMCFYSDSFENVVKEYFDDAKITAKQFKDINSLRTHIFELCKPMAQIRILSIKDSYNFKFKPSNKEKKELEYTKFICKDTFSFLGYDKLIHTIQRYFNQGLSINTNELKGKLEKLDLSKYDAVHIAHGHDISNIIVVAMKKTLGKSKLSNVTTDEIERSMRLSYTKEDFEKTRIKKKLEELNSNILK